MGEDGRGGAVVKAWYFSSDDCRLRYDDNRIIKVGRTHKVKGEPKMCSHGLHASKKIIDALDYAPGYILWRVELGGKIICGDDKCVATERTYLQKLDTTPILKKWARLCALDVIDLWDAPDVVVKYLKTGDESLKAAAWDAARAAARAAAWDAARKKQQQRLQRMIMRAMK